MSAKKLSKKVSSKNTVPVRPRVEVPAPSSSNTFLDDFRRMQQRMDALGNHDSNIVDENYLIGGSLSTRASLNTTLG